jgi:hypothetical protein
MGQDCKASGEVNGFANFTSPERGSYRSIAAGIGQQGGIPGSKTQSQDVDQTTTQDATDFHPTPKRWRAFAPISGAIKPIDHRNVGSDRMVIGHCNVTQLPSRGLFNESNWLQTSVAANGVAVKIQ